MRVAQYLRSFRLKDGGVVRAVLDLCSALSARGHEIRVLTFDPADLPPSLRAGGAGGPTVERLRPARGFPWRLAPETVGRVRRSLASVDVLHVHVPWDPVCAQLGKVARRSGVPYVLSLHGMLDDFCMGQKGLKKRAYLLLAGRDLLERAGAVHCTAEAERRQSLKWYPRGNAAVVPLVFDLAPFRELPGPELARRAFPEALDDGPMILYLGRLHPIKRIEVLIEAAVRLRDQGMAFRLAVAGSGEAAYERALRRLVERHHLSQHVAFPGFVTGREKLSLYEASQVAVFPSHHENWGFTLIEAMACCTPVVATRAILNWRELEASGSAAIVEPTPDALATAIAGILGDESSRRDMQRKARAWVLRTLAVDRVAREYEDLYRAVGGEPGRAAS